jgi:hypothetical protein
MKLLGKFSVGLLYLIMASALGYAKYFVVVAFVCHVGAPVNMKSGRGKVPRPLMFWYLVFCL